MSKLSDSEFSLDQEKSSPSKWKRPPYLKLVVSNPPPAEKKKPFQDLEPNAGFTARIQKMRHAHYVLMARDPFHFLDCEIPLEICDDADEELEPKAIVCHFPDIFTEDLNELVEEDETLQGMVLVQFQMKILKKILSFAIKRGAPSLFIHINHTSEGHALKVYNSLITHEHKIPATNTVDGTKTQLVIPINRETFGKFTRLADEVNRDFRYMLWEEHSRVPFIREYLLANPCLKFFG